MQPATKQMEWIMKNTIALASIGVLLSVASVQALPAIHALSPAGTEASDARLLPTSGERKQVGVRKNSAAAFKAKGGTVKDTCPGGDKACIDQLVASCDKAGGGLSTQPDGGVDCYVVGIHDQP
jgi:hypothetical protein